MMPRFAVESLPDRRASLRRDPVARVSAGPPVSGGFVLLDGEEYYRIADVHRMPPFLMSIASDCDLWMFLSSRGGLTAGRVDADGSLFPYETVDRLHDGHYHTGPITLLRVRRDGGRVVLWRPWSERSDMTEPIERNLYKNTIGNRVVFEEVRHDLELVLRYRWSGCDEFGHVRSVTLESFGAAPVEIEVLDGLRNVLPHGAPLALYQQSSSLVDAYKRVDVDPATQLGIFSLTSKIIDRAEAAEQLSANTVWCHGLHPYAVALSSDAVVAFRRGEPVAEQSILTGRRGNYLVHAGFVLPPHMARTWHLVADVGRDHLDIGSLRARLLGTGELGTEIERGLDLASTNLLQSMAAADGLQLTGHPEAAVHHFANVLFNGMRGGVFAQGNRIGVDDFVDFVRLRNRPVAERSGAWSASLGATIEVGELQQRAQESGDADLQRLALEYLPLYFGRRHGDPSRPWNRFRIVVKNPDGSRALRYEGNWRDIFQNWEALCASHPAYLPNMIAKFVNASTVDGFNPYRLTRDGIDWEVAHPDDPWSYIGYWGDHQIVYLLRFLEAIARHEPGALEAMFDRRIFSYANVPYRIASYESIVADPRSTITYDAELAARIEARVAELGTDAKLVLDADGAVVHVTLLEKLLVTLLAKLSNFVPGGGIWMNTQRPEWNDANNALVGYGVSVVTLCHLRRFVDFLRATLAELPVQDFEVTSVVADWFDDVRRALEATAPSMGLAPGDRRRLLDALGSAFSRYRDRITAGAMSSVRGIERETIGAFLTTGLAHLDAAIAENRRDDGLYHAYNLLELQSDPPRARLRPLYEMLEGQVAALSSGRVDPVEALRLLGRLFASPMYRADQASFLLYPERELPDFLARNTVPEEGLRAAPLLAALLERGDQRVIARDDFGVLRFCADFRNAEDLAQRLDRLGAEPEWADAVAADRAAALEVFERVFHHRSFTGRSGTMYGYEGIGCIYWHMVAKLLLAVQEIHQRAVREGRPAAVIDELARVYYRVRAGLGFEKSPAQYGAFPTDPYSHTPGHSGAQQPGMTGQVKEEILTRLGELGVDVIEGRVRFAPRLLRHREFLSRPGIFRCFDVDGCAQSLEIPAGSLAFTYCQVPVVYECSDRGAWLRITHDDGTTSLSVGQTLDRTQTRALFGRRGVIRRIDVGVPESVVLEG